MAALHRLKREYYILENKLEAYFEVFLVSLSNRKIETIIFLLKVEINGYLFFCWFYSCWNKLYLPSHLVPPTEGISRRVIFGGSNLHVYEFTNSIVLVIMNKNQVVCLCSSLPRCVVHGKLVSFLKFVCNKGYLSLRKPFYAILLQVYMNLINFHLLSNLIFKNSPLPLSIVDQKKKKKIIIIIKKFIQ